MMNEYTDLYLLCDDKQELIDLLPVTDEQPFTDIFETENYVVDWIGKVPVVIDEEGNVTEWYPRLHFNVRLKVETDLFAGFDTVEPATPYRTFA